MLAGYGKIRFMSALFQFAIDSMEVPILPNFYCLPGTAGGFLGRLDGFIYCLRYHASS